MKTLFSSILFLFSLCLLSGCYEELGGGFRGLNRAIEMDMQMQKTRIVEPRNQNSTFWQEQRSRQEYWDRQYQQAGIRWP